MKINRNRRVSLALAMLGLVLQQTAIASAAESTERATSRPAPPIVGDIAIDPLGNLHGQLVDRQGIAQAHAIVLVQSSARSVEKVATDEDGRFQASAPHGGVYALSARGATIAVRVWSHHAAPPSAGEGVLLIADDEVAARGQLLQENGNWIGLGLAGAIVAVMVVEAVDSNTSSTPPGPPSS